MRASASSDQATGQAGLLVPATLLAHGVGSPLNVLSGYTRLLDAGALGHLDAEPAAAVAAMRDAVRDLEQLLDLLLADLPEAPRPTAGVADLSPAFGEAWRTRGWRQVAADDDFKLAGAAWAGWPALFASLLAVATARPATLVVVEATGEGVALTSEPGGRGSGDDALALHVAEARARSAGLLLAVADDRLRLGGGSLAGNGRVMLRIANGRDDD